MKPGSTAPPEHLSAEMKTWWRALTRRYSFHPHHVKILEVAAQSWDRRQEARALLTHDGLTVANRFGELRAHPAIAIERDCGIAFLRAVRELSLADDDLPSESRPPRLGGYQGR